MQAVVLENSPALFPGDLECFEAYGKICSNMWRRYLLMKQLFEASSLSDKNFDETSLRLQIVKLTEAVKLEEWLFWERVARSKAAGVQLVVDLIVQHYDLEHFERRTFLFLLCFEFIKVDDTLPSVQVILNLLDLENSMEARFKNSIALKPEGNLFKSEVLKEESFLWCREVVVHPKIVDFVTRRLAGERPELPKKQSKESKKSESDVEKTTGLTQKFDQVILEHETKERIRFFLDVYRSGKFKELEIDKTIRNACGLAFLFFGPPGTGKTMLAEAIAEKLEKKLIIAETSAIFARYLGETDQNIKKIFERAKKEDAVLLFDEADSLIASREMSDGDYKARFVNLLLTELERFEGITILTTNMRDILDKALERRIALKVEFKLPTSEERTEIWRGHIPQSLTVDAEVRLEELAKNYEFSGGNIKNAMLNAIRRILSRNETHLTMADLTFGAELEKEGALSLKPRPTIGF